MYRSDLENFNYQVLEQWLMQKEDLKKELLSGTVSTTRREHLATVLTAINNLYFRSSDTHKKVIDLLFYKSHYPEEVADEIGYTISRLNSCKKHLLEKLAVELGWIYDF